MTESHALNALEAKYGELSGRLQACNREAKTLKAAMASLKAAMKIFATDFDTAASAPRRKYQRNPHFAKGNYIRVALDILRESGKSLSSREIAVLALQRLGVDDAQEIEQLRASIHAGLSKQAKDGGVIAHDNGRTKLWSIQSRQS